MAKLNRKEKWRRADEAVRRTLPSGVKLLRTLRGHSGEIGQIAWSPDGRVLASPSTDSTIRLWDVETGACRRILGPQMAFRTVAFHPGNAMLASGSSRHEIIIWDSTHGNVLRTLVGHDQPVDSLSWSGDGHYLASAANREGIRLWDTLSWTAIRKMGTDREVILNVAWSSDSTRLAGASYQTWIWDAASGHPTFRLDHGMPGGIGIFDVAWSTDPKSRWLASASNQRTVLIWDTLREGQAAVLEGHTGPVLSVIFSGDGRLLASTSSDGSVRLWSCNDWRPIAVVELSQGSHAIAPHPNSPLLAVVDTEAPDAPRRVIRIFELNPDLLLGTSVAETCHYVNAKVVLVGDTGVGKSGLSLVLNNRGYKETDSTAGRQVETFASEDVSVGGNVRQTRETMLWDLAGQPGYRVIHQLHLSEVAVALVIFDSRSETDPLAGVRHWERALRIAQQRQGAGAVPMTKFLVSARNDRGGVAVSEERLQAFRKEFAFDKYFRTSAKEGWQIEELRAAIQTAIPWERLPVVSSSQLFADIKAFLLAVKATGRLLAPEPDLYNDFVNLNSGVPERVANLPDQFETCIGRLANRDLIRRLTFGGYVLLQPELLDAYASAMVNAAKEEPDGLGSLGEDFALAGKFFVPKDQKVTDRGQEQLLLHATVEELVSHDLALRENADDGRYLVFPSQFNRDYEDAPEPKGKAVAITFDGPAQSLYAALAVRLGHSGVFSTGRTEMWRNAAVFTAKAGGKCGVLLHEFAEGRGRLILFYDEDASVETRFHFEEFVQAHTERRALEGTVELTRFLICANGHAVPDEYVKLLRGQGKNEFSCPCGAVVSLAAPAERIHFRSQVDAMDASADRQRNFEAFVMSAKGETATTSFHAWAGGERVTLAIVFTDVVGSTALGEGLRDQVMNEIRQAHFAQSRKLIDKYKGREIKTIGDSFMAAFKSVDAALDYAQALHAVTGHQQVQIRAGIHIGPMQVEEADVFGGTVNFAARVVGAIKDAEIWLSERAKEDIDRLGAQRHRHLKWVRHENVPMKGFRGTFVLWSLLVE